MKDETKNFVLFAVIAALILFGWPLVQSRFFPTANPPATKMVDGKNKPVANPAADPTADAPAAIRSRQVVLAETPRVAIDTPALKGSINLKGARLDDLVLTRYKETVAKDSPPIRLFSPAGTPDAYFASFGWRDAGLAPPAADTVWTASARVLTPRSPVTLTAANGKGQTFAIEIAVDNDYLFTVKQTVANAGTAPVPVAAYGLVNRIGVSKDPDSWTIHTGPMSVSNGAAHYNPNFTDVDKAPTSFTTTGGWLGFTDKYWLAALVPDQTRAFDGQFRAGANNAYQADFTSAAQLLPPGRQVTQTAKMFAGAKEVKLLDRYTDTGAVVKLDYAIDWGWFRLVEKPIFYYLDWLFRLIGNFGVAIIILTLTIRALVFPIAQRQFASMAAMRALQPKMKAIQERYKDDKQRQQQEIMALYKAEKVNPLAGCLPTLIQIPIFYALYKALMLTIEMRHQPFILWIKDLSAPDPATILNLFGYIPITLPHFLTIGVVPVLLGISMFFQFRLNPQQMDPTQQQVFAILPWVLMFVMAPFAVGLQIYWITTNCVSIAQQKFLYSRHPQLKEAAAK
ncbi:MULTISPECIES: membrane protein insertase YidC [Sphingomonas]|uniref:Membrane protein insertase YidC n=1 Tax=Sphingomonas ginsenosidimutans TaxID=862134 RepID=A0A2A4HVX3_9SPHN|nr:MULTISPECIES: membrane protein insertase YidC [Sphingomonas]MBY0302375.1 membrane protein insertase YidC [Sphingomonas ginsenosidimutans]PCG08181.1 membrane protein insertase YidC [Sphingomonas ginsenosidimutans]